MPKKYSIKKSKGLVLKSVKFDATRKEIIFFFLLFFVKLKSVFFKYNNK